MSKNTITPSQRTTSWLQENGWRVGTVERFIHPTSFSGSGHRRDLFGCIDLIAIQPGGILAVQSTGTDWSGHWRKLMSGDGRQGAIWWIETGAPLLLIGWRQLKAGWRPRCHYFLDLDFTIGCDIRRERSWEEWQAGKL